MKITIYKIVAAAPKKGRSVVCSMCGKPWVCKPNDGAMSITCGYCINGLVDGLGDQFRVRVRKSYMRLHKPHLKR